MKVYLFLTILLLVSCKNLISSNSSSEIESNYHPGMSNEDVSLPASFNLSLDSVSDQVVTISWGNSSLATSYRVVYGSASGDYSTTISSDATSPLTIDNLTNGTSYYFRVYAVNVNGEVQSLQEVTGMPMLPPNDPTSLNVSSVSSHVINLAWNNDGGFGNIYYKIYRSTSSGTGYSLIANNVTNLFYVDSGLTTGQTYYYLIIASNQGGNSSYSNEVSATAL